MAYAGNLDGPRTEQILDFYRLDFACGEDEVLFDMAFEVHDSQNKVVKPVEIDETGRPYLEFGPDKQGKKFRHYFDGSDFCRRTLHGEILTKNGVYREDQPGHWVKKV